jgi:predicted GNAT family acetyltransferase
VATSTDLSVVDNAEKRHYEIRNGSEVLGFIFYRLDGERITLMHTEVDEDLEGEGIGSQLVVGALDDIRRRGLTVVPLCPFVSAYLLRHPEYSDLVARS